MHRVWSAFLFCSFLLQISHQEPPLTPEQQTLFTAARKDFREGHPELALDKMKQLHARLPENQTITDGTAETAISMGDSAYAISLLKPWIAAHPDDPCALEVLSGAYAEAGDPVGRDQAIAAVLKLHTTTSNDAFKQTDRFLVERVALPSGSLEIYVAIVPFSPYHIYRLGRQVDASNALVRQITLESNDVDQEAFAKERPEMAAKGMRRFSVDTYSAGKVGSDGSTTQTQAFFGFIDGQPTYDATKSQMVKIATGVAQPVATRGGLPVPKQN